MNNLTTPELEVNVQEGVATMRVTRAMRRNAMDQALIDALRRAIIACDMATEVRAIVLEGAAPGFCAGSDLKYISALSLEQMGRFEQETGDVGRLLAAISKPVVGAVEGFAIGGGFILAACCDVVVTGRTARWSLPEVPHGWLTPWGLKALVARVGDVRARNLCFCLRPLDGEQVTAMGVADEVADDGTALKRAHEIARHLASLPPAAVQATKRFFSPRILDDGEAMDWEANRLFVENCRTQEAQNTLRRHRAGAAS